MAVAGSHDAAARPRGTSELLIVWALRAAAWLSVAVTIGIVAILVLESFRFFAHVSPREFFFGTRWAPLLRPTSFGVLPLVVGTLLVTVGALLIAVPFGVGSAIYLSEYASSRFRAVIKPVLEILAGIPTVVYGYFALTAVTPLMRRFNPDIGVFNAASASIVVGIMILPMVASLSDSAFRAVPLALRQAGHALGATKRMVTLQIVLPSALSGVLASVVLAFSRAVGETMAVTLAAGMTPTMSFNPFQSIQTMTAYIVQVSLGDTPAGSVQYQTIFAVGLLLFLITLAGNLCANWLVRRFRAAY